jgi:hypothetical protein
MERRTSPVELLCGLVFVFAITHVWQPSSPSSWRES